MIKIPEVDRHRQRSLDAFVTVYNENARSFEWRKAEVRQTTPQQKYADMTIPVAQVPSVSSQEGGHGAPHPPPYVHLAARP